ncbi:MAG: hypothetical protein WCR27_02555 [Eubacteriales bacterium]
MLNDKNNIDSKASVFAVAFLMLQLIHISIKFNEGIDKSTDHFNKINDLDGPNIDDEVLIKI